jgi:tRNA threonylcarbamoyladenosine biosynthesis protein TsaB
MIVLGLDTAVGACSAAVLADGQALAALSEPMTRGHQERLALMARETMDQAGIAFAALDRIGVTVGPGSFTGLRVGLAFAKGLGLALGKPCVGVSVLEALAASEPGADLTVAAIDARRGQLYLQAFVDGRAVMAPDALPIEIAAARVAEFAGAGRILIVGPGAPLLDGLIAGAHIIDRPAPDPLALARLAASRTPGPVRPLYLRAPDAKLPGGIDPVTLVDLLAGRAPEMAALHAQAFDEPWDARAFSELMASPGVYAVGGERGGLVGLVLMRAIAGEAEVLTLAVAPVCRRRGLARDLLDAALTRAIAAGAERAFLEVAEDNEGAIALYRGARFADVGRRPGYYARTSAPAVDALVLSLSFSGA